MAGPQSLPAIVTMKLAVLLLACSLAAGEQEVASPQQLSVALGHLYRQFLHAVSPRQLELQDALSMSYSSGMMAGPPHTSAVSDPRAAEPLCGKTRRDNVLLLC